MYEKAKKEAWRLRKRCRKQVSSKITTGFVAIYDLLQYEIKELYITGITFYRQGNLKKVKQYRHGLKRKHISKYHNNSSGEFSVFVDMCINDNRIVCDKYLNDIVKSAIRNKSEGK